MHATLFGAGAEVDSEASGWYSAQMKSVFAEPEIVTRIGKPVSVVIPIRRYKEMIERLEDAEDVAYLIVARRKPLHYRPLADVLADLDIE